MIRKLFQNSRKSFLERNTHTYIMGKKTSSFGAGMGGGGHNRNFLLFILITTSIGIYNKLKK